MGKQPSNSAATYQRRGLAGAQHLYLEGRDNPLRHTGPRHACARRHNGITLHDKKLARRRRRLTSRSAYQQATTSRPPPHAIWPTASTETSFPDPFPPSPLSPPSLSFSRWRTPIARQQQHSSSPRQAESRTERNPTVPGPLSPAPCSPPRDAHCGSRSVTELYSRVGAAMAKRCDEHEACTRDMSRPRDLNPHASVSTNSHGVWGETRTRGRLPGLARAPSSPRADILATS